MREMTDFFNEMDSDQTGKISKEQFLTYMGLDRMRIFFEVLGIDVSEPRTLFDLLDTDNTNNLDISEFVVGLMKFRGQAKHLDIEVLLHEFNLFVWRWRRFSSETKAQFGHIQATIASLRHGEELPGAKILRPRRVVEVEGDYSVLRL